MPHSKSYGHFQIKKIHSFRTCATCVFIRTNLLGRLKVPSQHVFMQEFLYIYIYIYDKPSVNETLFDHYYCFFSSGIITLLEKKVNKRVGQQEQEPQQKGSENIGSSVERRNTKRSGKNTRKQYSVKEDVRLNCSVFVVLYLFFGKSKT